MVKEYAVVTKDTKVIVDFILADEENLPTPAGGLELREKEEGDVIAPPTPPPVS